MFNNANVLYKTKFVDGVSTVTRYVQQQRNNSTSSTANKENNQNTAKKKTGGAKRPRVEELRN